MGAEFPVRDQHKAADAKSGAQHGDTGAHGLLQRADEMVTIIDNTDGLPHDSGAHSVGAGRRAALRLVGSTSRPRQLELEFCHVRFARNLDVLVVQRR